MGNRILLNLESGFIPAAGFQIPNPKSADAEQPARHSI